MTTSEITFPNLESSPLLLKTEETQIIGCSKFLRATWKTNIRYPDWSINIILKKKSVINLGMSDNMKRLTSEIFLATLYGYFTEFRR